MSTRREFIKKAGYAAPAIVTLSALPSFAGAGSDRTSDKVRIRRRIRRRKIRKAKDKGSW